VDWLAIAALAMAAYHPFLAAFSGLALFWAVVGAVRLVRWLLRR
jgi:hypothetical protein